MQEHVMTPAYHGITPGGGGLEEEFIKSRLMLLIALETKSLDQINRLPSEIKHYNICSLRPTISETLQRATLTITYSLSCFFPPPPRPPTPPLLYHSLSLKQTAYNEDLGTGSHCHGWMTVLIPDVVLDQKHVFWLYID